MVFCFAFGYAHRTTRKRTCSLYRFPLNLTERRKWIKLCRRADRDYTENDRLCSCHFVDGIKENGPTIFFYSKPKFEYADAPLKKRKLNKHSSGTEDDETEANLFSDHPYSLQPHSSQDEPVVELECEPNDQIPKLRMQIQTLEAQQKGMQIRKTRIGITEIINDAEKMMFYTSFPTDVFQVLINILKRMSPFNYYNEWNVTCLTLEDQLLITLMKLRLNTKDLDLAVRFDTSRATISNIVNTFIYALHEIFFEGTLQAVGISSQIKCRASMPKSFEDFSSARLLMDATEVTQDLPSNLNSLTLCYSNYKSRNTVKALTCVAPNGAIVFCSELYPGSTSDASIVDHCKVLDSMNPGDLILADKGFNIYDKLPTGVSLNIPPFLRSKGQFTKEEAKLCIKIARSRIHVERANERIKNYEILGHIPAQYRHLSTKIFQLCCCLVNFQSPLLKEIADKYCM